MNNPQGKYFFFFACGNIIIQQRFDFFGAECMQIQDPVNGYFYWFQYKSSKQPDKLTINMLIIFL